VERKRGAKPRPATTEVGAIHVLAGTRVHAALPHACAPRRLQTDSTLRIARQPSQGREADHLPRLVQRPGAATGVSGIGSDIHGPRGACGHNAVPALRDRATAFHVRVGTCSVSCFTATANWAADVTRLPPLPTLLPHSVAETLPWNSPHLLRRSTRTCRPSRQIGVSTIPICGRLPLHTRLSAFAIYPGNRLPKPLCLQSPLPAAKPAVQSNVGNAANVLVFGQFEIAVLSDSRSPFVRGLDCLTSPKSLKWRLPKRRRPSETMEAKKSERRNRGIARSAEFIHFRLGADIQQCLFTAMTPSFAYSRSVARRINAFR